MNERIGQGRTADVYRYGDNKVLKVFHQNLSFLADEEFARAKQIQDAGVCAPTVYDLIDVNNAKGIVYEYVQGITLLEQMQNSPLQISRYAKQLATMHAALHRTPAANLVSLKESLSYAIHHAPLLTQQEKTAILRYLVSLPNGDRLCHYDFHPGNVLVSEGGAKVIDWMTAAAGDPCADVCRTCLILRSNVQPYNTSFAQKTKLNVFRTVFCKSYLQQYLKQTSTTAAQVNRWLLPVAAARLHEGIESEQPYLIGIVTRLLSPLIS